MPEAPRAAPGVHYTAADFDAALRSVGLAEGDTAFTHVGMGLLGFPESGRTAEAMFEAILGSFLRVLGPSGTLLTPAYSYSFCRDEVFDPARTPSRVGPFSEMILKRPDAIRSLDPIFSVAGLGPGVGSLFRDLPHDCFGPGCVYERLLSLGAKICNVGVGFRYATFVHFLERRRGVPYRFVKPFAGTMIRPGGPARERWLSYVRVLEDGTDPFLARLEEAAFESGFGRRARVGRGEVTMIPCRDMERLILNRLAEDPWFLARGPARDLEAAEAERLADPPAKVEVDPGGGPAGVVTALCGLGSFPLSSAYDATLRALGRGIAVEETSLPTGALPGGRVVPERWVCRGASLTTPDGLTLAAPRDFLVPYFSRPFDGEVDRAGLLAHLSTAKRADAAPSISLFDEQRWGLSAPRRLVESLPEGTYRVRIDAAYGFGLARLGRATVPGVSGRRLALLAFPDHGGLANDGLSACAAAAEAARRLLAGPRPPMTIELLFAPRLLGARPFLRGQDAPDFACLIQLESLGIPEPAFLQARDAPAAAAGKAAAEALLAGWPGLALVSGESAWLSDQDAPLDAPRFPVFCLGRAGRPLDRERPYEGFRTTLETASFVRPEAIEESAASLARLLAGVRL